MPPYNLADTVRDCSLCAAHLPQPPRPILQWHPAARILIAGQAPGQKAHDAAKPFADASGDRLRQWLGITAEQFYNPKLVAILPMGFVFPGVVKVVTCRHGQSARQAGGQHYCTGLSIYS